MRIVRKPSGCPPAGFVDDGAGCYATPPRAARATLSTVPPLAPQLGGSKAIPRNPRTPSAPRDGGAIQSNDLPASSAADQSAVIVAIGREAEPRDGGASIPEWLRLPARSDDVRENWTMRTDYAPLPPPEPAAEPGVDRLTQLASLLRTITYGEKMELCAGIAQTGGGGEITQKELPAALLLWATERRP
jgi:hypothetical protein